MPATVDMHKCSKAMLPVNDALYVLTGKWKLPIMIALRHGNKRFGELRDAIPNITERMLSKELKSLEMNQLVDRRVHATTPVTVEYTLTAHGYSLDDVIEALGKWGSTHRKRLMKKK